MPPSNSFSTRSLRESLPELSVTSSSRCKRLQRTKGEKELRNLPPIIWTSRRYASPSSSSSARGSSRDYDIPPPMYPYIPASNRDSTNVENRSSRANKKGEYPNQIERSLRDPYIKSKHDDGRYWPEPDSESRKQGGKAEKARIRAEALEKAEAEISREIERISGKTAFPGGTRSFPATEPVSSSNNEETNTSSKAKSSDVMTSPQPNLEDLSSSNRTESQDSSADVETQTLLLQPVQNLMNELMQEFSVIFDKEWSSLGNSRAGSEPSNSSSNTPEVGSSIASPEPKLKIQEY